VKKNHLYCSQAAITNNNDESVNRHFVREVVKWLADRTRSRGLTFGIFPSDKWREKEDWTSPFLDFLCVLTNVFYHPFWHERSLQKKTQQVTVMM